MTADEREDLMHLRVVYSLQDEGGVNEPELTAIDFALDEGLDEKGRHDWRVEVLQRIKAEAETEFADDEWGVK
jgi:hypothetical protein